MTPQLIICLIIFACAIVTYCSGKFKLGLVAMTSLFLLSVTGCLDAKSALSNFANSNVIMIAAMCVVAAGFQRTAFCTNVANAIAGVAKGSLVAVVMGYTVIGVILSQFIQSPVTVFSIVAPMLVSTAKSLGASPSKVVFPVGVATIVTCCTLPLGAGATVAGELQGYLDSYYEGLSMTSPYTVGMFDAMLARLPMLVLCVLYCGLVAVRFTPDTSTAEVKEMKAKEAPKPLKPFAEWAGILIFFATAVGMMFADQLHMETWQICLAGAVLMSYLVITPNEALKALPLDMLFLIVGALAMAGALSSTGAGELIGQGIAGVVTGVGGNSYVVGLIFFVIPFILTQFMSNRGCMLIFHPIAIATCNTLGANPIGLMIIIQAGCLAAFMTPLATAAVPYIMSTGGYDQMSMIKQSLPIALITCVVTVLWTMTLFPLF